LSFGRWSMKGFVLVAAAALLVALLAACGSDSGGGKTPKAGETPSSGNTPASDQTPADGGGDGNGDTGVKELERLASEAAGDFTGKITYGITTEAGGQTTEQEWTLAQRPPDSRFEIVSNEGGQESRTIVIQTAEKSYVCTSAGGSEACLASDQTDQYTGLFDPIFNAPESIVQDIDTLGLGDQSERDIAGMHANCFSYSLAGAEWETCFSDEGLMLYLKSGAAGSSFTYEAKSASTDVTDADFEPPYPVTEIPTG